MYFIRVNTTFEFFFKVRNEFTFQYFNLYEQLKFMLSWVEHKIVYPQAETINIYVSATVKVQSATIKTMMLKSMLM